MTPKTEKRTPRVNLNSDKNNQKTLIHKKGVKMNKNLIKTATFSYLLIVLSGCSNLSIVSANSPDWPWQTEDFCASDNCTEKEALWNYIQASRFCRSIQNYYESGGQRANSTKLAIGAIGTLAGAVIAPIAQGTAASAWSGLSGATNGIQTSFDETFSASISMSRRSEVVTAITDGETAYNNAKDVNGKIAASIGMATKCSVASAVADKKINKAIFAD